MKAWVPALALVVVSSLLTVALLTGSAGGSVRPPHPGPTPYATATPRPPDGDAQEEPAEPSDLAHRQKVLQRFACGNCHGLETGWLLPDDHASLGGQDCQDCHAAVAEPPAIGIHEILEEPAEQQLCSLCHGDLVEPPPVVPTEGADCASCHADEEKEVLPDDHDGRSLVTCMVCHETQVLTAPEVPHRSEGWETCTFCHGEGRLTVIEGGHLDRADDECVLCHDTSRTPPGVHGKMLALSTKKDGCSSCHSEGQIAPLAADHEGRSEFLCGLCHRLDYQDPPIAPHLLAGREGCRDCHTADNLGALPHGHETRSDEACVACHQEWPGGPTLIPHTLDHRTNCTDCHAPLPGPMTPDQ